MESIKLTIKSDVSVADEMISYETEIDLEMAGKIIEYVAVKNSNKDKNIMVDK